MRPVIVVPGFCTMNIKSLIRTQIISFEASGSVAGIQKHVRKWNSPLLPHNPGWEWCLRPLSRQLLAEAVQEQCCGHGDVEALELRVEAASRDDGDHRVAHSLKLR